MTTTYIQREVRVAAFRFTGRNGTEATEWAQLPGGQLTSKSYTAQLIYRERRSSSSWGDSTEIEAGTWLVKEGDQFYWMDDAAFDLRFVPVIEDAPAAPGRPELDADDLNQLAALSVALEAAQKPKAHQSK